MKKIFLFVLCATLTVAAAAQGQIKTKQFIISDFKEKTMKVVLSGNDLTDSAMREQVQAVWNISPFEFCTISEFETIKTNPEYYFMVMAGAQLKKEASPGIEILGIYKGTAGAKDLDAMYKLVSIPVCSTENPDGREMVFLPALINILQNEVEASMNRKVNFTDGVQVSVKNAIHRWGSRCAIAAEDFASEPGLSMKAIYKEENIDVSDYDTIEGYITNRTEGVMVGYVVKPDVIGPGSVCYTMIIDAASWDLFYIRKHKISEGSPAGFTDKDTSMIIAHKEK